ncbi:MAG: putative bifunctional diguanylate cyclase/phosphodiesterase [Burkholderiales bacterium]
MRTTDFPDSELFDGESVCSVTEMRLLILASTLRDGEIASRVLTDARINCAICQDLSSLMTELELGAGAVLLAEEVLDPATLPLLEQYIAHQPNWSDLPIMVLTFHGTQMPALSSWNERLGKATLIERPVRTAALISIVRSALRGRQRQYLMRKSQQQLHESEQRFKSLFEHHPDGIVVRDLAGRLVSGNKAMETMIGYSIEELRNMTIQALVIPEDSEHAQACFAEAAKGNPKTFHARVIHRDGNLIEVEGTYLPLIIDGEIKGVQGISRDVTQSRNYERRIEHLATHDVLTELPNRHLLIDRMQHSVEQSRRSGHQIGVLFMDLNRFKQVNDSLGHDIGDLLLKEISVRLKSMVRETDTVARLGGDEFVVVIDNLVSIEAMATIAEDILDSIAAPIKLVGHELSISTSIGGSVFPKDGQDVPTLLKHADLAMYQAKELGSGSFRFYDPEMNIKILERLLTESALQRALEKGEFLIYYQPRVCVLSKTIIGVEALLRWDHPEKGLIAPADFIPLAEEIGIIGEIGEWVLHTACAQNRAWQHAGYPYIKMSVNLSAQQLRSASLEKIVETVLTDTNLEARYLELEITETGLMQNIELSFETLMGIRNMGVSISIDDFGTGYSSLSHIKRLPINTLKIDKSFIRDIVNDRNDAAIVCATIAMAQHMDLGIVAEGVTAIEQMHFLAKHQCNEMQGYFFSRPLPPEELEILLKTGLPLIENYMQSVPYSVH